MFTSDREKNCIFCKLIAAGDSEFLYEDNEYVAMRDINPQAPVHLLVMPKKHISGLNDAVGAVTGPAMDLIRQLAVDMGISESGYRVIVNCNEDGGQTVGHLHFHLLGGRRMKWPPG
ncbi:MAG: histidine triad nucleotide-binding protein [Elusimicrobia bacterium]|nr:histidine triad nucleotide-binding protein [Elusimicrobiota bacterium]